MNCFSQFQAEIPKLWVHFRHFSVLHQCEPNISGFLTVGRKNQSLIGDENTSLVVAPELNYRCVHLRLVDSRGTTRIEDYLYLLRDGRDMLILPWTLQMHRICVFQSLFQSVSDFCSREWNKNKNCPWPFQSDRNCLSTLNSFNTEPPLLPTHTPWCQYLIGPPTLSRRRWCVSWAPFRHWIWKVCDWLFL